MKPETDRKKFKLSRLETKRHRASMAACDRMVQLTQQRLKIATDIEIEYRRFRELLVIARGDVRSLMPALLRQIEEIQTDAAELVKQAILAGDEATAQAGARSLATWSKTNQIRTDSAA